MKRLSETTFAEREHLFIGGTFLMANVTLFYFALLPMVTLIWVEVAVIVVASASFALIAMDMFSSSRSTRVGYLMTGLNSLYATLAFLFTSEYAREAAYSVPLVLFLFTFALGGVTSYLILTPDKRD